MDKKKQVVMWIKVKCKTYGYPKTSVEKRKEFDGKYGAHARKNEKASLGETKEKDVYRKAVALVTKKIGVFQRKDAGTKGAKKSFTLAYHSVFILALGQILGRSSLISC